MENLELMDEEVEMLNDGSIGSKVGGAIIKSIYFVLFLVFSGIVDPLAYIVLDINEGLLLAITIPVFALGFWFVYSRYKKQLAKHNPNGFGMQKISLKKVGVAIAIFIFYILIQTIFSSLMTELPQNQQLLNAMSESMPILFVFSVVIAAPLMEELLFRGIFFNYFFNKDSIWYNIFAVLLSGLLFGLMHEPRLSIDLLLYSSMGWAFGSIYMVTKDLRYSMGIHLINNTIATLPLILSLLHI